jgi:hypothetical protein
MKGSTHIEYVRYPIGVRRHDVSRVDRGGERGGEALQQHAPYQANSLNMRVSQSD